MVFIQTLSSGLIDLDIDLGCSVYSLKNKLEDRRLAPAFCQRLIHNGNELIKDSVLRGENLSIFTCE